jgi:nicotinamidase-related amidase
VSCALILIDMLNPYDHEDAEPLMSSVANMLPALQELIERAREAELLTVYVNDNHGDWSAGPKKIVKRALDGAAPSLIEPIEPDEETPFIIKARHSIFYQSLLEYVLRREGVERIILAGQVTEQCVLYSALDAYVRHFEVVVPRIAVAHIRQDLADAALQMMEANMRARITGSVADTLQAACAGAGDGRGL